MRGVIVNIIVVYKSLSNGANRLALSEWSGLTYQSQRLTRERDASRTDCHIGVLALMANHKVVGFDAVRSIALSTLLS